MTTTNPPTTDAAPRGMQQEVHQAWNAHHVATILDHLTEDVVWIDPARQAPLHGKLAVADSLTEMFTALPDLRMPADDVHVATCIDPPMYIATWTAHATMTGPLQGIPASGRPITWSGTTTCTIRDGLISEYQMTCDVLGMLQQLGVLPRTEGLGFKAVALATLSLNRVKHALDR